MIAKELKNTNISQAEIEQHENNIKRMKEVQANQQADLNNSIRILNEMISAYEPLQAEFETEAKRVAKLKQRSEEDFARIAEEKVKWNSVLANTADVNEATELGNKEGMKEHHASIQLAKKKLEDLAVAEQRWQAGKEFWSNVKSSLDECTSNLSTLESHIKFETRIMTSLKMRIANLQKEIDKACTLVDGLDGKEI